MYEVRQTQKQRYENTSHPKGGALQRTPWRKKQDIIGGMGTSSRPQKASRERVLTKAILEFDHPYRKPPPKDQSKSPRGRIIRDYITNRRLENGKIEDSQAVAVPLQRGQVSIPY